LFGAPGTGNTFQRKYHKDLGPTPPSVRFGLGRGEASVGSPELRAELEPIPNAPLILNDVQGDMRSRLSGMDIPSPSDVSALVGVDDSPRRQKLSPYDPQGPPPPPITAPMESGVSPRQSGFTGSLDWDVMDGNIYDSLGASVTETEEERRRREREERDQRSALASGFGRASEMLLAGGRREPVGPMANIGFPGYAGRSRRFA